MSNAKKILISQHEIKKIFHYNPETGELTNRINRARNAKKGAIAGGTGGNNGYRRVVIDGCNIAVHRLIWVYVHGSISEHLEIDHLNHKRDDNRICNLRLTTHRENGLNQIRKTTNVSGVTGVFYDIRALMWCAKIKTQGKHLYLGSFDRKKDAIFARLIAEKVLGFHENHGGA